MIKSILQLKKKNLEKKNLEKKFEKKKKLSYNFDCRTLSKIIIIILIATKKNKKEIRKKF